jgi:CRISPR-associated Cas5-like protein
MAATTGVGRTGRTIPVRSSLREWTTETRHAVRTTEFYVMIAAVVGILAAAYWVGRNASGVADAFPAERAWLYVSIVVGGYMISRGLAKAGSCESYRDDGDDGPPAP